MFAALVRTLCGALVLLGVVNEPTPRAKIGPGWFPANLDAVTLFADPAAPNAVRPEDACRQTTIHQVYRVTAYCDRGLTAAGVPAGVGQCAAPTDIPFGSQVYIAALDRTFIVTDRTARRFRHNTVDLFIPDRAECLKFGRRYLECEITLPGRVPRYGSPRLRAMAAAARR